LPSGVVQWGIVAVVLVVVVVVVSGSLVRAPAEQPPIPMLSQAERDLVSLTRMLGDVRMDSALRSLFPAELQARLAGPDTMFQQGKWFDAAGQIDRLLKKANPDEVPALRAYLGVCFNEAASPDRALQQFRKGLASAESTGSRLAPWLAFSVAYLFQGRGFQDSAVAYYARARQSLGDTPDPLRLSVLNNAGVAYQVIKDTAAARVAFDEALTLVGPTTDTRSAALVRENLGRLARR
jgi:tetratricopeptide (TPR) repeat protein